MAISDVGANDSSTVSGSGNRAEVAVAEMRAKGVEPLEPYPGTTKPWRCRCTTCGNEVSPRLGNIRSGKQGPCRHCGNRRKSARMLGDGEPAAALMLARGYQPLEPYPGCNAAWRCRHLPCGAEVLARYGKVRAGEGCCGPCGIVASATKRSADPQASATIMLDNLLEPLEPYPGSNHRQWKSRCLRCGAIVYPTRANVTRGQGGCVPCGKKKSALGRMGDAGAAAEEMLAALLEPLEPYPGSNNAWRCRCLRCGDDVAPRLVHIRAGRGGCLTCGFASNRLKQLGDPTQAVTDMKAEGYLPLEDYPGASKPWRARHEPCGNEVKARLQKIRAGEGCCAHCATYGFNLTAPAVVYVLHHREFTAVKVGVTAADSDRIDRFTRKGWAAIGTRWFATGAEARDVEQAILRELRIKQGLRHFLTGAQTSGTGGSTETFATDDVSPRMLMDLVAGNTAAVGSHK